MSTLQEHVSTLHAFIFSCSTLLLCIDTSFSCVNSWSSDLFSIHMCWLFNPMGRQIFSKCVDSSTRCVNTSISDLSTIHMCRYFNNNCQHLLLKTYFIFSLAILSINQYVFFKSSSSWMCIVFKIFKSVSFIASSIYLQFSQILQYSSQDFMCRHHHMNMC